MPLALRVGQFVTESNYTFEVFDHRARLLRAAVGFALVPPGEPELRLLLAGSIRGAASATWSRA